MPEVNPKVSIIIPVFNAEKTLGRAMRSVINQSYANKELIVVDGLSSDGSVAIIENFRQHIAHFISEKDTGVYSAINKGLNCASGEWIYIMGADDELADTAVLSNVFSALRTNVKLIFGSIRNMNIRHKLVAEIHDSKFNSALHWRNSLHQQSAFYHRSLFADFRFDEQLKILADYDFHLKLLNENISFEKLSLLVARCEASGLSKNFVWNLYREELRIKKRRLPAVIYAMNLIWVVGKFLGKKISQNSRE